MSDLSDTIKELTESKDLISISELTQRFVEIDEYYMHEDWNLEQILAQINIIIPKKSYEDALKDIEQIECQGIQRADGKYIKLSSFQEKLEQLRERKE